jgi:type IV pilus assembly protein PilA
MNNVFTAKFLQHLNQKKADNKEKGFTLIELLVVVIIVGVLAAVALPNLLGQVGKARETEAKNAIGTLNRSQQSFHFDTKTFVTTGVNNASFQTIANPFGVSLISEVFTYNVPVGNASTTTVMTATPVTGNDDGVRGFAGQVDYATASGTYGMGVCQGTSVGVTPSAIAINISDPDSTGCTAGTIIR